MSSKQAAGKLTKEVYSSILQNIRIKGTNSIAKNAYELEQNFKGIANHTRINILYVVAKNEGITLDQITQQLEGNFKTISEHTKKLVQAQLIIKKYIGTSVSHNLTDKGQKIITFLQTF